MSPRFVVFARTSMLLLILSSSLYVDHSIKRDRQLSYHIGVRVGYLLLLEHITDISWERNLTELLKICVINRKINVLDTWKIYILKSCAYRSANNTKWNSHELCVIAITIDDLLLSFWLEINPMLTKFLRFGVEELLYINLHNFHNIKDLLAKEL